MTQLICKDLTLGYEGRVILKDLNFQIKKGDYLCIIGSNGTGKTTLMKAILGLKRPMSGDVLFGQEVRQNEIGYLTQQSEIQRDFPASVWEVVLSGFQSQCGMRPYYKTNEKVLAEELMKKMGILETKKRCYRELSGGQQQRVLLARALCATKELLFLDEPVTGLDPMVSEEMYEMIYKINKEDKVSVILISHDVEHVLPYATHILHIGKETFFGTSEEYQQRRKNS